MPLQIIQVGDPVLRQSSRSLTRAEIFSPEIQQLIIDMRETMHAAPGVGLAAPQVGWSIQLAVIEDREQYHKDVAPEQLAARERKPVAFHVLINPEIGWRSEETKEFFEGCLSLDGFCALVTRARSLRVHCLDETGSSRVIEATGWYARILQHEIDHLHGCLYIDRMKSRTLTSLDNLTKYWKGLDAADVLEKLK